MKETNRKTDRGGRKRERGVSEREGAWVRAGERHTQNEKQEDTWMDRTKHVQI